MVGLVYTSDGWLQWNSPKRLTKTIQRRCPICENLLHYTSRRQPELVTYCRLCGQRLLALEKKIASLWNGHKPHPNWKNKLIPALGAPK